MENHHKRDRDREMQFLRVEIGAIIGVVGFIHPHNLLLLVLGRATTVRMAGVQWGTLRSFS